MGTGQVTEASDPELFLDVLDQTVRALDDWGGSYVVFGSIAIGVYVDHPPAEDIDVFVREQDVQAAADALTAAGFEAGERRDWLRKIHRDGVTIDLITNIRGVMQLDAPLIAHARRAVHRGRDAPIPAAEDLVMIAAVSAHPETPDHWFTATRLIAGSDIDWDYVRERSRLAPVRLASLLLYCRSDGITVPDVVVEPLLPG